MRNPLALTIIALSLALTANATAAEDNTPPKGFTALFNGKDTTGWQGAVPINERLKMSPEKLAAAQKGANAKVMPHWKAVDGVLMNDGEGDNLATIKDYGDFELLLDWKIEPKGDSGVYLRGFPQVQIWDSDALDPKRFKLEYGKGSGALWNNFNPKDKVPIKRADKAPGEWNHFHIVMKGDKVTVKLNDELVVDGVALDNLWERGKPLPPKGPIELQRHPKQDGTLGKLWFKNIYIKELSE
jgi:hypothetical protein